MPAAFVTYGWCRSAYTVVRSLARRGVEVHVGDSSTLALSRFSRYTKSFTLLPDFFSNPDAYMEAVSDALERTGARVLLPCFEDVELVIRFRKQLPENTLVAVPALDDWTIAEDKFDYVEQVRKVGCPVPETWQVDSLDGLRESKNQFAYPVVVKVRMGNGARGVEIVERPECLEQAFMGIVREYDLPEHRWPVLQKSLHGRKYKLDGVFSHGRCVGTGVYEILRCKGAGKFGTSTYRVTADFPKLTEHCVQALESLNWHGMFNTDWICDEDGTPHLIDINGRLSGGVAVPYLASMDLPWLWYQVSCGIQDVERFVQTSGVKVRWLVGDAIGLVEHGVGGQFRKGFTILKPELGCRHDDFSWRDPLPLFAEAADYFCKFVKSSGSVRPNATGMVR